MGKKPRAMEAESVEQAAKPPVPTTNSNLDAPTIFVDSLQGGMVAPGVTKLMFIEQLIPFGEGVVQGRYVLNMAMPTDQIRPLGEALIQLADQMGL